MFLEAENLNVSYGDIEAVRGVSIEVEKGELVSIIGANGAGKSSILNALMGLAPCTASSLASKGEDIRRVPIHERARRGIRIVPERARLFPRLTVRENLATGRYGMRNGREMKERLTWLYGFFPILDERRDQLASTLSGGQQQQLAIARALVANPELILVDEVSMGLMPKLVDQVFTLLKRLNKEFGLTVLLVEQNARASLAISDRAYVLETGSCAYHGRASELVDDPRVKEAYLG